MSRKPSRARKAALSLRGLRTGARYNLMTASTFGGDQAALATGLLVRARVRVCSTPQALPDEQKSALRCCAVSPCFTSPPPPPLRRTTHRRWA
jgi:hypothetical protein